MKSLFTIFFVVANLNTAMANFAFTEILLKKDLKNNSGIFMTAHTSVKTFCMKRGNPLNVGSFEAAQFLENLEDGFFRCFGEFTKLPNTPVNAFKIYKCEVANADEINQGCSKI
jgi:hypothetical protein